MVSSSCTKILNISGYYSYPQASPRLRPKQLKGFLRMANWTRRLEYVCGLRCAIFTPWNTAWFWYLWLNPLIMDGTHLIFLECWGYMALSGLFVNIWFHSIRAWDISRRAISMSCTITQVKVPPCWPSPCHLGACWSPVHLWHNLAWKQQGPHDHIRPSCSKLHLSFVRKPQSQPKITQAKASSELVCVASPLYRWSTTSIGHACPHLWCLRETA